MFYRTKPQISSYYQKTLENIKEKILRESDNFIIGTDTKELSEFYLQDLPHHIQFDDERGEELEHKKELRRIEAHKREEFYRNEGAINFEYESVIISMYFLPNDNVQMISEYIPSTRSMSWTPEEVNWYRDHVSFGIDIKGYGINLDENGIKNAIQWQKDRISERINSVNGDITQGNEMLKTQIPKFIEERKRKLSEDKDKIDALIKTINIPLKKKESEAVKRVQLDTKPLIKKIRPNPSLPEVYELDREKVVDIISIIDNQGRQFEKTPDTYKTIGEEGLRNVLLVSLNTVFEGKATGETFSNKGKTDIYLCIDKGNILVCECKIWGGKELYNETIDQLLGYLTWRQNYGIIITFVKQVNFSKVIEQIPDIVKSHSSYTRGYLQKDTTHFISHHKLNGDDIKDVEIHHLFYNLYFE
ncbi:MAG: hypothetical protein PHW24_00875 [Candidatus Moranbacteria bacterium]|nr:hypothetical protein [Candidatus Moranbacteria bacterium]